MNHNLYLNPIPLSEYSDYMKNLYSLSPQTQSFQEFCQEKDLKDRCEYWRCFCKSIYSRKKRLPTKEECEFNGIFKPIVSDDDLLTPKEDDPIIFVTTAEDWAEEDIFLYDIEKMGYDEHDYHEFLGNRQSTYETREQFLLKKLY